MFRLLLVLLLSALLSVLTAAASPPIQLDYVRYWQSQLNSLEHQSDRGRLYRAWERLGVAEQQAFLQAILADPQHAILKMAIRKDFRPIIDRLLNGWPQRLQQIRLIGPDHRAMDLASYALFWNQQSLATQFFHLHYFERTQTSYWAIKQHAWPLVRELLEQNQFDHKLRWQEETIGKAADGNYIRQLKSQTPLGLVLDVGPDDIAVQLARHDDTVTTEYLQHAVTKHKNLYLQSVLDRAHRDARLLEQLFPSGFTPLAAALMSGNLFAAQLLIRAGADYHVPIKLGKRKRTVMEYLVVTNQESVIATLADEYGVSEIRKPIMAWAKKHGKKESMQQLLERLQTVTDPTDEAEQLKLAIARFLGPASPDAYCSGNESTLPGLKAP